MPNVFRWDITRREQLGRLVEGGPVDHLPVILDEVRQCAARVVASAGDARLVFIGRSPENIYDYLTGAFAGTSRVQRLAILNISLKGYGDDPVWIDTPAWMAERERFRTLGLDPAAIASSPLPIALIDVIYAGETFRRLLDLLFTWAGDERIDVRAVRRRLRIVGITERSYAGPKTQRWRRLDWARQFRPQALKGVAIPWWFWSHLANSERKVSRSNPPASWGDATLADPPRAQGHTDALRLALGLYTAARTRAERDALAAAISTQPSMREPWCRVLVAELRAASRPKRIERAFSSKQRIRSWRRHVDRRKSGGWR